MTEKLDTKLAETAIQGDLDSFGELCRQYYGPMVAIAYSVLADHHLAQDAVQEAFAKALLKLRTLKDAEKFAPWLGRICRNVAKDMVKAKRLSVVGEDISQISVEQNDDNIGQAVRDAIANLPDAARELIVLRYYNNLSYEQISVVLGLSKAAINARLGRAKQKLAKTLKHDSLLEDRL